MNLSSLTSRSSSLLLAATLAATSMLTTSAFAQGTKPPPRRPVPPPSQVPQAPAPAPSPSNPATPSTSSPQPTTPSSSTPLPAPGADAPPSPKRATPTLGTIVERVPNSSKDWTFTATIRVNSEASDSTETVTDSSGNSVQMPTKSPFKFDTMTMVFPAVPATAACDGGAERASGSLRLDGQIVTDRPEPMATKAHSGVQLLRFGYNNTANLAPREVILEVAVRTTAYQTKFDEKTAIDLPWPSAPWPDDAASTFAPQLFVDIGFDKESGKILPFPDKDKLLDAALKRYLAVDRISDPRASTPVRVAKAITKGVWSEIQPSGDGLTFRRRTAELAGITFQAPETVLATRKASEHDITCLMAFLFRKAGLPTRTVIAWDVTGDDKNRFLRDNKKANKLRSWVEFYLFDDAKNTYNWVPVDVVRARKSSSRPPSGNHPWRFFGELDDSNELVPFALQFHPPTDVVSYGSGSIWGWFMTPKPPEAALQAMNFRAERTPVTGAPDDAQKPDPKDDRKRESKPKTKRGG